MAIGRPLLVNQRRDIERPAMSAQTQQLSSNVPVQKINFMSYDIGQASAKASRAVPDELLNMVNKSLQAKLYIDNTKREYERLNLMEDWQRSNMDFQGRFAQARTPEAQATVIADYENDTQNRIGTYTESQGKGVKQQAQLADLKNTANTQFSKFSVTHQNNLFKQTAGMLSTDTATIAQSVAEDANVDPVSAFKKIADNYGEMVAIGALDAPTAQYKQRLLQDQMITGRSTLFAQNYAKDVLASGAELPSEKDFKQQINGVMGLELSERRLKLASEAFNDAYYKELKTFNSEVAAEDAFNKEAISADLAVFKSKVDTEILDKTLTEANKQALYEESKQFDSVIDGYSEGVLQKLDAVQFGTASQPQVDHFTVGQGGLDLQAVLQAGGVDYYDLEAVEYAARNAPGEYAGMNENTILGIVKHYRNENATLITQFSKRAPLLLKTNMVSALKNKDIFLQSEEPGMTQEFWNALAGTSNVNWESAFSQDPDYGEAFTRVQGVLAQAANKGTGPYDKDEIGDDVAARTVALNSFIQRTIATEFGAATAQKRAKSREAEERRAEADIKDMTARASGAFRYGGKTQKGKPYIGAEQTSTQNLQSTLATQGADKYQGIKERIQTDLQRMSYDAQPDWVKAIDQTLAKAGQIEIGTPEFKDVAAAVMGSTNTAYLTGLKNKQLKNEVEGIIERPLTKDELDGKSPLINEMASTVIKREKSSSIGRFVRDLFSSTPSESEKKLENLGYEFKQQSLRGIQKGLESVQPKPEPTAAPNVAETTPTPVEQLSEVISNVISPSAAEAVTSISRDSSQGLYDQPSGEYRLQPGRYGPDSWNPGQRYLDANGEFTDVMPLDVRDRVLSEPEAFPDFTTYNLVQGDNLGRVAQSAGITLEELQNLNSNTVGNETRLQIGDPILLPKDSNVMPSVASPMQDSGQQAVGVPDPMAFDNALMGVGQETPQVQQPENYLEEFILKREGTPQDAIADVGAGIDADGVGYGHIATAADKRLWAGLTAEQRKIQAREWLREDIAKASRGADKQLAALGRTPSSANAQGLKDMLTFMNFQLGEAWHTKKFKKAWAGLKRGDEKGQDGMFRNKSGWEQAIYHLMHTNESSNAPSKWLKQTPKRVMDAVMSLHYMSDGNGTEDIIGYIDSILQDTP
tara:strand:+ start:149 stop:3601 length:3453 start_codon:yes stop_codon:yes gene_type:complete